MDTNLMSKELKQLLGIHEPTFYKCLFAVVFDGSDLEDNLTDSRLLPKEAGIYKCTLTVRSYVLVAEIEIRNIKIVITFN